MIRALIGRGAGVLAGVSWKVLWPAIGALVVAVGVQSCRVQSKSEDIGVLQERARLANETAKGNKKAAVKIAERLTQCVNQRALDAKAERAANAALERRVEAIRRISEDERDARNEIYEQLPECEAWRSGLVCVAIADRMRDHTDRLRRGDHLRPDRGADEDPGREN